MIDSLEIIYKKNKSISFYQLIETISVILLVFSFATVYTRLFSTNYDLYLHTFLSLFLLLLSGCALYRLQKAQQSLIPIIRFIWLYYLAFLIPFHILNSFNYPINLTFLLQLGILPLTFPYFYYCFLTQKHYQWLDKFVKLMKILATISLFFWLFGSLLNIIPATGEIILDWGPIRSIPNYYFSYFETQTATLGSLVYPRNSGIFTEAPMFAAALSLALITEYCLTKTTKTTIILIFALLSTGSYTAILILLFIGSHYSLQKLWTQIKKFNLKYYRKLQ